jgi:hypothetical protein
MLHKAHRFRLQNF